MIRLLLVLLNLSVALSLSAAVQQARLYLNGGTELMSAGGNASGLCLNKDATFSHIPENFQIGTADSLRLILINNDGASHRFFLHKTAFATSSVASGDSTILMLYGLLEGAYVLFADDKEHAYLGANALIAVDDAAADGRFYWNLREISTGFSDSLLAGKSVNWTEYDPEYFLVNGKGRPDIDADPDAHIVGQKGETLMIYMINTGRSIHSIHFHGYHVRIRKASKQSEREGWIKDTVPIEPMEAVILEMIPDKPGKFPVHDHNLMAVGGGGYYPSGMFVTMDIQ